MAIYITQGLYLSGALDDGYQNANNPLIGYENLLEAGSVTATYEETDYPATNMQNVSTGEYWKSSDNFNLQYLTMQISPGPVNYFGIAGHNLLGAEIKLQRRDDPADPWTDVTTAVIPADNHAIMWYFETVETSAYWRLYIEPSEGVYPRIGVLYMGAVLVLQRRTYVGHTPVTDGQRTSYRTGLSQSSQYLGRVRGSQTLNANLDQNNVDPQFYRDYVRPFARAAETRPFFMAWRPSTYPEEVGFCWTTRDITPKNALANGYLNFSISGQALAPLEPSTPGALTTT